METGEYHIGINPNKGRTGKGTAVRIVKVKSIEKSKEEFGEDEEVNFFYALGNNLHMFKVEEQDFQKPGFKDPNVEAFKAKGEGQGKYQSYLGYDFGEVIPSNVNGYKNMVAEILEVDPEELSDEKLQSGFLVFLGKETEDEEEYIRICWLVKVEKKEGEAMSEAVLTKDDFLKYMLVPMEDPKRFTIHYINTNGEKTSMAVNSESEIKDMKEELYRMNN